ncbi:hypothetical protein CFP56_036323 [Quercus suber]|uniref:Uncharacterized protein n=1 Tax=Quercus suber TaxID=58331 RepID=A0AAW0J7V6_QUESU
MEPKRRCIEPCLSDLPVPRTPRRLQMSLSVVNEQFSVKPSVGSWVERFRVSTEDSMMAVVLLIWGGPRRRESEAIGILR